MANDCERIDKILSHHGFGSRKDVKKLMRGGFVVVNGKAAFDPGMQIRIGS
ncbi:S4 domain-containing protein, partial [Treponema saccharophilum]